MSLLLQLTEKEPFNDKLVFGEAIERTVAVVKDCFYGNEDSKKRVAIVACEADYLFIGKTLRDEVILQGFLAEAFVLPDLSVDLSFLKDFKTVICLGSASYYGKLAVLSKKEGFKLINVATSLIFADGFAGVFPSSMLKNEEGRVFKIIVDVNLLKKLKRKDLADGYAFCAALSLSGCEALFFENFYKDRKANTAKELLTSAYKTLRLITPENIVGTIVVSELYVAAALYNAPYLLDCGGFRAGKILSNVSASPLNECVFRLIAPLLLSVKGYLRLGAKNATVAFFNDDVSRISEILGCDELSIYENCRLESVSEISKKRKELQVFDELKKEIDLSLKRYKKLLEGYDIVYKGRKSLAAFTQKQEKTALKLGGLSSAGLLKQLYDDGFLSVLEEI